MFGIGQEVEERLERVHRQLVDGRPGEVERLRPAGHGDRPTVGEGDHLVDACRRSRRRHPPRPPRWPATTWRRGPSRLGPVHVPAAGLRDRADVGDRVVEDLLAERPADVLARARDRRGGTDVRPGRHHGDVRGQRDEGAGAGRAAARRRDPDDDRDRRLEQAATTICWVASRLPPGVLSAMTTAASPRRCRHARSPRRGSRPCTLSTMPVAGRTATVPPAARAGPPARIPRIPSRSGSARRNLPM